MNLSEFISQLYILDIRLWVKDGTLHINAPKGALTVELREKLASQKEEIIQFLQESRSTQSSVPNQQTTGIVHLPSRTGNIPLSFSQQRLWFLDQFDPGNTAYSIPFSIQFDGELDHEAFEKSLNDIVFRHESLRTTFSIDKNGVPVQIIRPFSSQRLPLKDLTQLPGDRRVQACLEFMNQQATVSFDLQNGPLFRAYIIRVEQFSHYLFINMHHIVSDGWSTGIFVTELAALYRSYTTRKESFLPELAVQYTDYAIWQRQYQGVGSLRSQMDYWTQKLSGKLPILDLPTDHPRPVFQSFHGQTLQMVLSPELTTRLKQFGMQHEVTLFMLLLAAYNVLLYRYTGQEDLLVGTPIANRNQNEIETLIGFFVNTLVIRNNLAGNPTILDFLDDVRETSIEAFTNHDLPFEHIVEALHPVRDTSHSPIFQVMFILQNTPLRSISFEKMKASPVYLDGGASKYDLTLIIWESPEGMSCFFEYNTDLFERSTIERMMGHYQTILDGICANPEQRIAELPLLTAQEHEQILHEWNSTHTAYPTTATIQAFFEAQVDRSPEKIAIIDEETQVTYRELDRRANRLAHTLRANGVGAETLVGICLPRTIDMVVSLLAILKAGAAYVPLDPNFPRDRLAFMLEDSGAPVLLTRTNLAELFNTDRAKVICLDLEEKTIALQSDQRLAGGSHPENLAYVIYTSGSTGKPKGVQVLQRGVVNFLTSMQREPGLTPGDILLSVTTLSFDIAGLEIYLPLINGARLILVSSATAANGSLLKLALEQSQATIMQATPATWRLLIASGWQGNRQFKILCGGEALPTDLVAGLLARCGSLWNMYGPTETTIWSTLSQITTQDAPITIGHPIANTQVYVLDAYQQPVPVGRSGELHIGGDGLARGYLNRPELTAEKFIRNPFDAHEDTRLYRTGDLVRFLADGQIEFLGRIDHQVKLRGFRIELGEIETVLSLHNAVRQAVVVAREDTPGDKRLVAYLTFKGSPVPSTSELRAFLHERLPEYMIPALFIPLETFPLTPNGKVDRRALPAPETTRPDLVTSYIAPRSEIEQGLAAIWQQALKVEKVGVNDNFFELGGHSLLIVQVHHQILQAFQTDITIAQMFQYPTIQTLSQYLGRSENPVSDKPNQDARERARLQKEAIDRQRKLSRNEGTHS
jgi:amino acid adenylation domain-containing protein